MINSVVVEAYLTRLYDAWVNAGYHPTAVYLGFDPNAKDETSGQACPWLICVENDEGENFKVEAFDLQRGYDGMLEYSVEWQQAKLSEEWD